MLDCRQGVATLKLHWRSLRPALDPIALNQNDIHLVLVDLDNPEIKPDSALLSAAELTRMSRIANESIRRYYVHGRVMLRRLLHLYTGISIDRIEFNYGTYGKPELASTNQICFNYSDCSGLALFAFSRKRELGIDLERLPRTINHVQLAQRILSAAELDHYYLLPESQRADSLLACWTRKEAFGKAIGVGIRYTMGQVPVCNNLDSAHFTIAEQHAQRWSKNPAAGSLNGVQLQLPLDAVAACVHQGTKAELSAFTL